MSENSLANAEHFALSSLLCDLLCSVAFDFPLHPRIFIKTHFSLSHSALCALQKKKIIYLSISSFLKTFTFSSALPSNSRLEIVLTSNKRRHFSIVSCVVCFSIISHVFTVHSARRLPPAHFPPVHRWTSIWDEEKRKREELSCLLSWVFSSEEEKNVGKSLLCRWCVSHSVCAACGRSVWNEENEFDQMGVMWVAEILIRFSFLCAVDTYIHSRKPHKQVVGKPEKEKKKKCIKKVSNDISIQFDRLLLNGIYSFGPRARNVVGKIKSSLQLNSVWTVRWDFNWNLSISVVVCSLTFEYHHLVRSKIFSPHVNNDKTLCGENLSLFAPMFPPSVRDGREICALKKSEKDSRSFLSD